MKWPLVRFLLRAGNSGRSFATLVVARVSPAGLLEVANAGHCTPLIARQSATTRIETASLPLGMFTGVEYEVERHQLDAGDTLVLYTDGVTETNDREDADYGCERVEEVLRRCFNHNPRSLVDACIADLAAFRGHSTATDDVTLMAVRRN